MGKMTNRPHFAHIQGLLWKVQTEFTLDHRIAGGFKSGVAGDM